MAIWPKQTNFQATPGEFIRNNPSLFAVFFILTRVQAAQKLHVETHKHQAFGDR